MQPSISKLTAVTNCIWLQNQEEALLQWFHNSSFQNFHFETTPPEIPLFTYILCHKVKALRNNEYSLTYDKLLLCNNYWVYDHFKPMIPREPHLPSWNTAKKSNTDLGKKKKKKQTDNQESSWNKQSKSQSWGDDWGGNESYGRVTDEVQLAGLLLTSWCVIHLHPWSRGPLFYVTPLTYSYDKPRHHSKKQRHHFADKGPYSQSYVFSSSHVRCESWTIKETKCPRIDAFKLW